MHSSIEHIFNLLKDGRWHSITEISQKTKLHEFKIQILTDFLAHYSFLEISKKEKRAKLSNVFAEFLKKTRASKVTLT